MKIDADKIEKGIKYAKIIGIIIIIVLIIFLGYRYMVNKTNTNNFYNYLNENYKKQKDGSYEKEKNKGNKQIIYRVFNDNYLFTKEIDIYNKNYQLNIILYLNNEGIIKSDLNFKGKDTEDSTYGTMLLSGTYNLKKDKFECKTIINNEIPSKCNILKKETNIFSKEIKKVIKKYNINYKYIKKN